MTDVPERIRTRLIDGTIVEVIPPWPNRTRIAHGFIDEASASGFIRREGERRIQIVVSNGAAFYELEAEGGDVWRLLESAP